MTRQFLWKLIFSQRSGSLIRKIAILSFFSIGISLFAFLLVNFVMSGMNATIRDRLVALDPHLTVYLHEFNQELVQKIKLENEANFLSVIPFVKQDLVIRTIDGQFRGVEATGFEDSGIESFLSELKRLSDSKENHSASMAPEQKNETLDVQEVMIGYDLARSMNIYEGDQLTLMTPESLLNSAEDLPVTEKVVVKKIIYTQIADLDTKLFVYSKFKTLLRLQGVTLKRGLEIKLKNPDQASRIKNKMAETFPDLQVLTWGEKNSALFFALKMERFLIAFFLALAGLIAASSILTVMTLLLSQKKKDIVILRVLGLSTSKTQKLFWQIGSLLAGFAIVFGMILASLAGLWIEAYPLQILPDIYYDSEIPAKFSAFTATLTGVLAFAFVALAAFLSVRKISELKITEVLSQK